MTRRDWLFGLLIAAMIICGIGASAVYVGSQVKAQVASINSSTTPMTQAQLDQAAAANLVLMDQRIEGGIITLNGSGVGTWTYPYPFAATPVISYIAPGDGGAYPVQCNYTSVNSTSVTIKCYKGAAVTVSILGAVVNAFQGSVTGLQVHLHARSLTQ